MNHVGFLNCGISGLIRSLYSMSFIAACSVDCQRQQVTIVTDTVGGSERVPNWSLRKLTRLNYFDELLTRFTDRSAVEL